MTEDEVRSAVEKDFHLKGEAVRAERNLAEQTTAIIISVPDLLEGGGRANVSYVFGYKSKALIQVAVTWSKNTDESITPERLFSNANILRAHFLSAGYQPDTIISNAPVPSGLIMFRGADAKGHTTALVLQGTFQTGEKNQRVLIPTGLLLYYVSDAKSPDTFKLAPNSF